MLVSHRSAAIIAAIIASAAGVVGAPTSVISRAISGNLEIVPGGSWTAANTGQVISAHGEGLFVVGETYYSTLIRRASLPARHSVHLTIHLQWLGKRNWVPHRPVSPTSTAIPLKISSPGTSSITR